MRLNLGEIVASLGCGPENVIWQSGIAGDEPQPLSEHDSPSILSLKELARTRNGGIRSNYWEQQPWANITPTGGQVDSRRIQRGNLFFCLPGERVDGHDFALEAAKAGAIAVIATRNPFLGREREAREAQLPLPPVFLVENVKTALWRIAMCHRDTTVARVVGITGSAGKTSVKEVLAQVLAIRGFTERNQKNLNNQVGLPVSMLNAHAEASFWIMEAGISEAHDMDELGQILRPDVAVILNVGDAHVEGLAERGVAANKALFLDYIQPGGVAVVSADYPDLNAEVEKRQAALARRAVQLVRFSSHDGQCAFRAAYAGPGYELTGSYEIFMHGLTIMVDAPFRGEFGNENLAAICAVAHTLGLSDEEITRGLACAVSPEQRFCSRRIGDFILVDDSYNANPLSMKRMIDAAATLARENDLPLLLVLGEMLELGDKSQSAHEDLGGYISGVSPLCVFWKGGHANAVRHGLERGGYTGDFYPIGGGQDFSLLLEELKPARGTVLFKASRGMQLERLVDVFRENIIPGGDSDAV